jgi:hypothetical protein
VCNVCGAAATNGVAEVDSTDPRTTTMEFRCDDHRPSDSEHETGGV